MLLKNWIERVGVHVTRRTRSRRSRKRASRQSVPAWQSAEALESRTLLTPTIVQPAVGDATFDTTPRLEWTDDGAASYEVWLSELGASPHAVYLESGITGTSISVPETETLNYENHRLWLRSTYANGSQSAWTAARDFTVGNYKPESLVATSVTSQAATLSWAAVEGADSYIVWLSQDGVGQIQLHENLTSTSLNVTGLQSGEFHTFWVQAVSDDGSLSAWSTSVRFETLAGSISNAKPMLTGPDAIVSGSSAHLEWDSVTGATRYRVWLSESINGSWTAILDRSDITNAYFDATNLQAGHNYRYWVQAFDSSGTASLWSSSRDFSVSSTFASQQPVLTGPAATVTTTSAQLEWGTVSGATSYTVWIDEFGQNGTTKFLEQSGIAATQYYATGLVSGNSYRYWVRAEDSSGTKSLWSAARDFSVTSSSSGQAFVVSSSQTLYLSNYPNIHDIVVNPGVTLQLYTGSQGVTLDSLQIGAGATVTGGELHLSVGELTLDAGAALHATQSLSLGEQLSGNTFVGQSARISSDGVLLLVGGHYTFNDNAAIYGAVAYRSPGATLQSQGQQADTDFDDLSDIDEIYHQTSGINPDTDGDWLLDGFEVQYGLDPLVANDSDRQTDADSDGLTLLQEQIFGTNPFFADTDGDGTSDAAEANAGGNPLDPSDGGVLPSAEEVVTLRLTVGDPSESASERYVLQVGRIRHQSQSFGSVDTADYRIRISEVDLEMSIRVLHIGSNRDVPDYDYTAAIEAIDGPDEGFHFCLMDPDQILGTHLTETPEFYAAGHEAILVVAGLTDPYWHHLLPRQFEQFFTEVGFDIHDPQWGWLMEGKDHNLVHPNWNNEWAQFWNEHNPETTTKQQVIDELERLFNDEEFLPIYERGAKPHLRWSRWNGLTKLAKSKAYRALKHSLKLFGYIFVALGAKEAADAAFAPVLALGNDDALADYKTALNALSDCDANGAIVALFGAVGGDPSLIAEQNPRGLLPKMLSRMVEANSLQLVGAISKYNTAFQEFTDYLAEVDFGSCCDSVS